MCKLISGPAGSTHPLADTVPVNHSGIKQALSAGGGVSLHISLALECVKLALPASVTSSVGFSKLNSIDTVVVWTAQILKGNKNKHFTSGRCV